MIKVVFACILVEFLVVSCTGSNNSSRLITSINIRNTKSPFVSPLVNQTVPDAGKPNISNPLGSLENPSKNDSLYSSIMNSIFKQYNVRLITKNANSTIVYVKKPANGLLFGLCNPGLIAYAAILNNQFTKLWNSFLDKKRNTLEILEFNDLPKYNNSISNKIKFSELKIKKLVVKGMQNMKLVNYNLNLCEMSFEFEFVVPKLNATGAYTAHGMIDGKLFNGNGDLSINLDEVHVSAKSSMNCDVKKYPENLCKFVENPYKKMKLTVKSAKINLSGVTYDNMINSQINKVINDFVDRHLVKSSDLGLVRKIVDVVVFKSDLVVDLSPTKLMEKLNSFLNWQPHNFRKSGANSPMKVCSLFCSRH